MHLSRLWTLSLIVPLFLIGPVFLPGLHLPSAAFPSQEGQDETITLPLNEENGIPLTRLLDFTSQTLGYPILYVKEEIQDVVYHFTTKVKIAKSELQGFVELLLLDKEFIFVQSQENPSSMGKVFKTSGASAHLFYLKSTAKVIDPDDLKDYANRGILITIHVSLSHIDCRQMITSLTPYFPNHQLESVRPVENVNALIITAVANKACQILQLIRKLDTPAKYERANRAEIRIEALEKKVAALEKRLAAVDQ
jgi:hypothetical protein